MDGLPKQFVSSLKILFDILDENRTGFVRLKDIESRWSDDGVRGLPAGVVDGLRRVTPQNGLLSFDKFVAGLKLVLSMRQGNELRKPFTSKENKAPYHEYKMAQQHHTHTQNDTPFREPESNLGHNNIPRRGHSFHNNNNTTNEPAFGQSRKSDQHLSNHETQSFPAGRKGFNENDRNASGPPPSSTYNRSREESPVQRETTYSAYAIKADVRNYPTTMGSHQSPSQSGASTVYPGSRGLPRNSHQPENVPAPALPPRTVSNHVGASDHHSHTQSNANNMPHHSQMRKSRSGPELVHAQSPPAVPPRVHQSSSHLVDLKNWQREWTANQQRGDAGSPDHWQRNKRAPIQLGRHDNNAIYANIDQFQRKTEESSKQQQIPQKATVRRHGSGRRHTLSSGIDQNMLKRMKQLEEEKAILQAGLGMVDSARDWYLKQLSMISDRQALLGKVSYNDNSLEAHQERMSFQRARIMEVNQQLGTLVESSEKGFPLHMNLAVTSQTNRPGGGNDPTLFARNRKLMEEMNHKTNQISQLEKEKASLIRDLFEARSKHKAMHDDTTFM